MRNNALNALTLGSQCTYWEAIVRVRSIYLVATVSEKAGIRACLAVCFMKENANDINADLVRGTP